MFLVETYVRYLKKTVVRITSQHLKHCFYLCGNTAVVQEQAISSSALQKIVGPAIGFDFVKKKKFSRQLSRNQCSKLLDAVVFRKITTLD